MLYTKHTAQNKTNKTKSAQIRYDTGIYDTAVHRMKNKNKTTSA